MELCSILKVQPYPMPLLTCAGTIQAARCAGPLLTAASRGGPHKRFLHVRTDNAGRFSMELSPGNYDVFAHLDGFAPTCTEVSAEADKTTTIELRFPRYVVTSVQ